MIDSSSTKSKPLSVFSLVAINIIAVDSLRTLPISAEYGFSLVFYYLLASLIFFIPVSLIAAELATGWPKTGGIYIWVKEAFGKRLAFLTIWLQWIYNIVWYPTILAFVASTLAYLISPELAHNKVYLYSVLLSMFWLTTLLNCFGIRLSSFVSIIGAILGTLLPMLFIILLALAWLLEGRPSHINISWQGFIPNLKHLDNLVLFGGVLFGLVGMEMSAVHAGDVKDPQSDYPQALFYSTIIIFTSLVLGSLAIAVVVPQGSLSLVTGLIAAFDIFFTSYHIGWMTPIIAALIILGSICMVSTWIIGPAKGLMVSSQDGILPLQLAKLNRHGAPVTLLIFQGVLFSFLSTVFIFMDNVNASYWLLSALTAQLALMVYVFMFAAAIKLRLSKPTIHRSFRIPGNNLLLFAIAGIGLLSCLFVIMLGFLPPAQIPSGNIYFFEGFLWSGMVLFVFLPWYLSGK